MPDRHLTGDGVPVLFGRGRSYHPEIYLRGFDDLEGG